MDETAISTGHPGDDFSANITVHGARVYINATTLDALLLTLTQFGYKPSASTPLPVIEKANMTAGEIAKAAEKTKPEPKKEAAAQVEKSASAAPAPAASAPATQAAEASTSATSASPSDEPARPTYDDVKKAVLALAKISPDTAKATLAKFTGQNGQPCDHGTKLKLEDYPAFLKAADEHLKVAA